MPRRILSRIAVAAALVISGVSLDLQADPAHADDCLSAPKAASPQGQHWYYRIDRTSHRKCWYLHATLPVSHRAVITRAEHNRLATHAGAAASEDPAETAPRLPELRTLAEKLHSVLFVGATSDVPSQQIAQEESDSPSIAPESSTDSGRPDAGASMSNDAEGAAQSSVPAGKAGIASALGLIFFLLVPGLAVAGFLVHVVTRIVSKRPIDVPETAWIEHQFVHERSELRGQQKVQDHRSALCLADPRSRERPADQNERIKESSSVLPRRSQSRSQHLAAAPIKPLRQNVEGIERALRAIRQARRQRTA